MRLGLIEAGWIMGHIYGDNYGIRGACASASLKRRIENVLATNQGKSEQALVIFYMREESMKIRSIYLSLTVLVLAGCSMTLPVKGQVQNSQETFSGTATGYLDGGGDLTIVSSEGTTCTGNFVYVTSRNGEGVFACSDGRTGPFSFVSTGTRGTGHGTLGGKNFTFTFGR